jgi:hypothetical protein
MPAVPLFYRPCRRMTRNGVVTRRPMNADEIVACPRPAVPPVDRRAVVRIRVSVRSRRGREGSRPVSAFRLRGRFIRAVERYRPRSPMNLRSTWLGSVPLSSRSSTLHS